MKLSQSFFYTLREDVKDEESISGNLLTRAGFIKKSSAGIYMMMPLGYRVNEKITQIIREEMDATGAQELRMPSMIPEEVYEASGRRSGFGSSMFALKDRKNQNYVLGPTHEELFAIAAQMKIRSYKDMPFNLYQFQTKFRDEPRPRFGLIRVREFTMKDAYSFDRDEAGLDVSYQKMFDAYKKAFDRMGIDYRIVKADTGIMGGLLSEEFQAITPIGEDIVVYCDDCGFSSNLEVSACVDDIVDYGNEVAMPYEKVCTPNARTIEEVCTFLHQDVKRFAKTLIYLIDEQPVAVMVRGDREVNEIKLQKLYGTGNVCLADAETVTRVTHAKVGFAGPIGIDCPVVMDKELSHSLNIIVGANADDAHLINVNLSDFTPDKIADVRCIADGDICPNCGKHVRFSKGIEIGNTFKLGTKYSKAMNLQYLDSTNTLQDVWMGSYGIGTGRCMGAIVEQNHDENGIIWPKEIAPYTVAIVIISNKDEQQVSVANNLYEQFKANGIDVILDDRDERPGVKFKDMDLIGVPYRITVGKGIVNGNVECKKRWEQDRSEQSINSIVNYVISDLKN